MHRGPRFALVGTAGLVIFISSGLVHSQSDGFLDQLESAASFGSSGLSSLSGLEDTKCQVVPAHVLSQVNLTREELNLLPSICWDEETGIKREGLLSGFSKRSGVPPGVQCERTSW